MELDWRLCCKHALVLLILAMGACSDSGGTAPASVANVQVIVDSESLLVGQTTQGTAVVRDASGQSLTGRAIAWSTSASAIATVTATGLVTAIAPGSATITATSEGKSGSATITVALVPVAIVSVMLDNASLTVGQTTQATAVTRDASGSALAGRAVAWSTSNVGVATVAASGLVTAVGSGSATITAASEGKSGSAIVTVVAAVATVDVSLGFESVMPGQTTEADAVLRDSSGSVLQNRPVSWTSSDTTIASVASNGVVSTLRSGTVTISATSEGRVGTRGLSVQQMPPAVSAPVVEFSPPVYSASAGKGLTIILDGSATTAGATFTMGGVIIPFRRLQNSTRFIAQLSHAQVGPTCQRDNVTQASFPFCAPGTVLVASASGTSSMGVIAVPQAVPTTSVMVRSLAPNMQRTDFVVNIRDDGLRQTNNVPRVTQTLYQHFGDIFDFLALCEIATTNGSISFSGVRNRVMGLGLSLYDQSAAYGASPSGKLLGFLHFRNYFDLAHQVTSHEIGHAFSNFLLGTAVSTKRPHWPLSTTAFAIMGTSPPPPNVGSNMGYHQLVPIGGGAYRVEARSPYGGFNNLELYQLGLADSSEVEDQVVFLDETQSAQLGSVLQGPVTTVKISDIVAANGLRTPGYTGTPVTFRLATVVVTRGRLLTASEMAHFEARARRGEATTRFNDQFEAPFYVNTRGRGILVTRIP